MESERFAYSDSELRKRGDFKKTTRCKLLKVSYKSIRPGIESELEMHITVESDPFVSKTYIYIIGIALGVIVLAGIIVILYVFRSRLECCSHFSCCDSAFVRTELPAILGKYPETAYTLDKNKYNQENCPICLCAFKENMTIRILECRHIFHGRCIIAWFTRRNNDVCPICNANQDENV